MAVPALHLHRDCNEFGAIYRCPSLLWVENTIHAADLPIGALQEPAWSFPEAP